MRRALGTLLLATLLLAGCGDDTDGGRADDSPSPSPSQTQSQSPTQSPSDEPSVPDGQSGDGWRLVEIVHGTAVDGRVSTTPTPVGTPAEVEQFSAQFTRPQMQEEILRVVEQHQPAPGTELVAAVVAIGCDAPPGVTYVDGEIKALKAPTSGVQCLAAMTSVAILEVEA